MPDRPEPTDAPTPPLDAQLDARGATPMIAQFIEIKAANPDCLLFYRMGDFYELFFQDAVIASRTLGIALTKRGQHQDRPIPMCGVPVERSEDYLHRLIRAGHRVAVCEQLEDPAEAKKRAGAKALVKRDVVRMVTPGTLVEDGLLDARAANWLMALAPIDDGRTSARGVAWGVAWVDLSTGALRTMAVPHADLDALIARVGPAEIVAPDGADVPEGPQGARPVTRLSAAHFLPERGETRLKRVYGVATLDGFGRLDAPEIAAAGALLAYLNDTQRGAEITLEPPRAERADTICRIDAATRASLEITQTLAGARDGSLLNAVDRTVTPPGARLLAERLAAPLFALEPLRGRHDEVGALVEDGGLRRDLRGALREMPDLARALSRLTLRRGSPRDLGAVRRALHCGQALAKRLAEAPPALYDLARDLTAPPGALLAELDDALEDELPVKLTDGGLVREGYTDELDEARRLRDRSRDIVASLQAKYANETGIKALKVKHNNVLGYFLEAPAVPGEALRKEAEGGASPFIHRQTLANCVRFTTAELSELDSRILAAREDAARIEARVFEELRSCVAGEAQSLHALARAAAGLDVAAGFAELAAERDYTRPILTDGLDFAIEAGRHPVVEQALKPGEFVANSCALSPRAEGEPGKLVLLTGPNMAGKSTYLRQNALLALLAQAGSFVPAASATIGLVDRIFSRVGAADDISRGRSTFMVEMVEAAAILNQAGPRALVIMDEIGRGTATYDGLSIAWGVLEHLHETNEARGLFATHYHELTALTERLPRLTAAHVTVKEWRGDVVFLHEVKPGAADRSYGVQVGRLAGLPRAVVARAKAVLAELESGDTAHGRLAGDMPLFAAPAEQRPPSPAEALLARLQALDPDAMTPREAHAALCELVEAAASE